MYLNKANLIAAKAASTDDTRPTLNSLRVTPEFTEATNGHILIRVAVNKEALADNAAQNDDNRFGTSTQPKTEVLLSPKYVAGLNRAIKKNACQIDQWAILDCANANGFVTASTTTKLTDPTTSRTIPTVEGPYPGGGTQDVIDKAKASESLRVYYSAKVLKQLFEILAQLHPNQLTQEVAIDIPTDHAKPMVVTIDGEQPVTALAMPLRHVD